MYFTEYKNKSNIISVGNRKSSKLNGQKERKKEERKNVIASISGVRCDFVSKSEKPCAHQPNT